jgi:hypothetical protein
MTDSWRDKIRAVKITAFKASIADRRIICLSQAGLEDLFPVMFSAIEDTPELRILRTSEDQAEEFAPKHGYRYRFDFDSREHCFLPNLDSAATVKRT